MIDYDKLKIAHEIMLNNNKFYCIYEFGWSDKVLFHLYDDDDSIIFTTCDVDNLIAKLQELTKPEPKYKVKDIIHVASEYIALKELLPFQHIESFEIMDIEIKEGIIFYSGEGMEAPELLCYPTRQSLIEAQIDYWVKNLKETPGFEKLTGQYFLQAEPDINSNQPQVDDYMPSDRYPGKECENCRQMVYGNYQCPCGHLKAAQPQVDIDGCQHEKLTVGCKVCDSYKSNPNDSYYLTEECRHESDDRVYMDNTPGYPNEIELLYTSMVKDLHKFKCKKCGEFYR